MRRRPQEQHDGEGERKGPERIRRDGRGAREHGEAAGEAADHDVPPGAPLQPHRVDDAVGEGAEKGVDGGGKVDGERGQSDAGGPDRPRSRRARRGRAVSRPVTKARRRVRPMRASRSRSTYWLNAPAAAEAIVTASASARICQPGSDGPGVIASPGDGGEADHEPDPQLEQVEEQAHRGSAAPLRASSWPRCLASWLSPLPGSCGAVPWRVAATDSRRRRAPGRGSGQRPDRATGTSSSRSSTARTRSGTPSPARTCPARRSRRCRCCCRAPVIATATGCGAGATPSFARTCANPGVSIFLPRNTLPTVISRYMTPPTIAASPQMRHQRSSSATRCPGTRSPARCRRSSCPSAGAARPASRRPS